MKMAADTFLVYAGVYDGLDDAIADYERSRTCTPKLA